MGYCSASNVAALTPSLVSGGSNFTASTTPTLTSVEFWLSSGCGKLHVALAAAGYSTPVSQAAAPAVYDQLFMLNALYAAGHAELSRANVRLGPGERTRGQVILQRFEDDLEQLLSGDLTNVGLGRSSAAKLYAGGISESDKKTVREDSDRVSPRFSRDMLRFPDTVSSGEVDRSDDWRRAE